MTENWYEAYGITKPYYADDAVCIVHGDCREILPLIPPKSIDLVLTDPPYGFHKAGWDVEFNLNWANDISRITDKLGLMPGVWNVLDCPRKLGELNYQWILAIHIVNGMTRGCIGFGNWIPCLVYTSINATAYKTDSDIKDVTVGTEQKPDHPSPKPLQAIWWLINRLSESNNLILDPFLGSGTTAVAAKILGRRCIGIELEEKYCEIAARRCQQSVMQLDVPPAPIKQGELI